MIPGERTNGHATLIVKEVNELGFTPEEAARVRMVVGLFTPPEQRRQGHAHALMKQICREADEDGTLLLLEPKSDTPEEIDDYGLQNFYRRFGFTRIQKEPVTLMARRGR